MLDLSNGQSVQGRQSISSLLKRLWHQISRRRRLQFAILVLLMMLSSFAEVISIGAVLPFLGVLTAPESVFNTPSLQPFIQTLKITEPSELLLPLTISFGMAALIAGAMRLLLLWASIRLSFATGADLSISIYRRTLYQPYAAQCARNSSEVINGITTKTNYVAGVVANVISIITSSIMLIAILIILLLVNPVIALASFGGFGVLYLLIIKFSRNQLMINSQINARESTLVIKSLQEGLGGIRDVLIDGSQATYCKIYAKADHSYRRAQGNIAFISNSPRYVMEALGMVLLATLAYLLMYQDEGIAKTIPILGAMALGAQRLLPVLQQAYSSWSGIRGSQASLQDALELLEQPLPDYADLPAAYPLPFMHKIVLRQINFAYSMLSPYVLRGVNLTIPKGGRVGFIGVTGSGKSTLLDIIMGLLQPTNGVIEVDGCPITLGNHRQWQAQIAHVPQVIFLADCSVAENIAFGLPKEHIDFERVMFAAQQAQISETIESWPQKYQTFVGERGVRLSGGQRQRIGIARALYKQANVIIFDEATSALDSETEMAVMQAIEGLSANLTLLIIAHRITTLKNCTQIVEMSSGTIKRVGTYQQMINQLTT
ncbi:ABC transporter ATP-binding protein [Polynucleobacter sp. MWH-UH24A]|nr:ABC transporter ATP-binding protein [Polynucleobacter sp. MWH-UH24A]